MHMCGCLLAPVWIPIRSTCAPKVAQQNAAPSCMHRSNLPPEYAYTSTCIYMCIESQPIPTYIWYTPCLTTARAFFLIKRPLTNPSECILKNLNSHNPYARVRNLELCQASRTCRTALQQATSPTWHPGYWPPKILIPVRPDKPRQAVITGDVQEQMQLGFDAPCFVIKSIDMIM
jgi:hypothetical protein